MGKGRVKFVYFFVATVLTFSQQSQAANNQSYTQGLVNDLPIFDQIESRKNGRRNSSLLFGSIHVERQIEFADFDVDATLSPIVDYRYNFNMVLRNSTPDGSSTELKDGTYLVRMVILRPPLPEEGDPRRMNQGDKIRLLYDRYVSGFQGFAQVSQGLTRLPVTFRFRSVTAMSMRNTLLLQILPIQEKSLKRNKNGLIIQNSSYELNNSPNYMTSVHRVSFIPRIPIVGTSTPAVVENDYNIEESLDLGSFMSQAENYLRMQSEFQIQNRESPKEYSQRRNLVLLSNRGDWIDESLKSLRYRTATQFAPQQFERLFEKFELNDMTLPEGWALPLCAAVQKHLTIEKKFLSSTMIDKGRFEAELRSAMVRYCQLNPEDALSIVRQVHVGSTQNEAHYLQGQGLRIGLTDNFGTNRVRSQDSASSYQQSFNPVDVMGALRLGYSYSVTETQSRQKFSGSVVSTAADLQVQTWNMAVNVEKATVCLLVIPRKAGPHWLYAENLRGLYICGEPLNKPIHIEENYFHIVSQDQSLGTIDLLDPRNQTNLVLRGQRDYHAFLKGIEKFVSPVQNEKSHTGKSSAAAQQKALAGLPAASGIYSEIIDFSGPKVDDRRRHLEEPTFWDRFFHRVDENF